jgi:hypothetical protein
MEMLHLPLTKFNIQPNYNLDLKKTYFIAFTKKKKLEMELVKKVLMSFFLHFLHPCLTFSTKSSSLPEWTHLKDSALSQGFDANIKLVLK